MCTLQWDRFSLLSFIRRGTADRGFCVDCGVARTSVCLGRTTLRSGADGMEGRRRNGSSDCLFVSNRTEFLVCPDERLSCIKWRHIRMILLYRRPGVAARTQFPERQLGPPLAAAVFILKTGARRSPAEAKIEESNKGSSEDYNPADYTPCNCTCIGTARGFRDRGGTSSRR